MKVQFIDSVRGITQEIDVTADAAGLHLRGTTIHADWGWDTVQMHNGSDLLRFLGPDGALFELPPDVLADALRLRAPGAGGPSLDPTLFMAQAKRPEGLRNRRAAALLLACVAVMGCSFFVLDLLSDQVAQHLPSRWEDELGAQLNGRFVTQYCETPAQYETLRELSVRLLGDARDVPELDVHISRQQVENAYSLPGGSIVIDSRLLRFMNNSDELAGVLGHEIEHVLQHHVMRALVRGTLATTLWSLALGDYTGMLGVDPSTLYKVAHLKFDRDAEWEADHGAVRMLTAAQISPQGLADFFKRLAAQGTWLRPSILTAHPSSARRMEYLESSVPPEAAHWHEALDAAAWQNLHRGCDEGPEPWDAPTNSPINGPAAR